MRAIWRYGHSLEELELDSGDDLPLGRIRGVRTCASDRGTFGILALDHRQNLRNLLRPSDPASVTYEDMVNFKRAVVLALGPVATGVLLDPEIGAAPCVADGTLKVGCGLIVAIEATGYQGSSTARVSRVLDGWSVAKAKRMGASAAKLLVYYNPDASNAAEQEQLVARVAAECATFDLPLFIEPLSFSVGPGTAKPTGAARRRVVVETARRLTALGGDVLKAEFPCDTPVTNVEEWRESCEELDSASQLPWVLLSGGIDDATFEAQVAVACQAGASGVAVGRSVWADAAELSPGQRDSFLLTTGVTRLRRLIKIVDELGVPWDARPSPLRDARCPDEGWYRRYAE
jgi:tagatose-1,6-bisphosphate aldolase